MKRILLIFILFTGMAIICRGQTYVGVPVNIVIPTVLNLEPRNSPPLSFNFNSTTTLDQGIEITGTSLTFHSNKAWFVTIQAGSPTFSGGDGTMSASVLKFKRRAVSTYTDLSATPQSLRGTSGAKVVRGTGSIGIDFKMDPGYLNPPADNYSILVFYTISNL